MTKPVRLRTALSATTILAAGLIVAAAPARAQNLPDTGRVTAVTSGLSGGAPGSTNPTFTTTGTSGAQTLQVDLKDNRTILNWSGTGFDIAAGNTVDFKDARATSGVSGRTDNIAVLNRDLSGSASGIYGNFRSDANVAVYVINQAGMVFGENSSVTVGSLLASTSDVTNDNDFLNASSSLRFGVYGAYRARPTINAMPGAQFSTASGSSESGARIGDLVFIGSVLSLRDNVNYTATGDAAFIGATDVTVRSSPGSPLSFSIQRGSDIYGEIFNKTIHLSGSVNARNITVAAVNSADLPFPARVNIDASLSASGVSVTDRGIVLTAGSDPSVGVTVSPSNTSAGEIIATSRSALRSDKDIYLNGSSTTFTSIISGVVDAANLLDISKGTSFESTGSVTAGTISVHGGASFRGAVTTRGDFTFDGGTIGISSPTLNIGGNLIGTATNVVHTSGNITVGGEISVTTSAEQVWSGQVIASGPVYLNATGLSGSISTAFVRSLNDSITLRSLRAAGGNTLWAAGMVDVESIGHVRVDEAIGNGGVRLVAKRGPTPGFDDGRLVIGRIVAEGATADVTLSAYTMQAKGDYADGGTIPISVSAGRDISITQDRIQRALLLGTVTAGRNVALTGSSISATKVEGTTGAVNIVTTPPRFAGEGAVSIAEVRSGTNTNISGATVIINAATIGDNFDIAGSAVILGSTSALSNMRIGGNLDITSTGAVQLRASIGTSGDINATGSTVSVGNGAISGGQVRAKGAINLTARTSSIQSSSNVVLQSNSDGVGDEAITLSAATGINFGFGSTLQGGTDRQSDVRIRSAMNSAVTISNLSARSLLSATGSDPFINGITRNAGVGLRGTINLIDSLNVQGTNVLVDGSITVTSGNIDLRSASPLSINGALSASGDISAVTSAGGLRVTSNGSFTGRNVLLSTPGAFVNEGGANIISASGRWLVYSANPADNTFGGLDSGNTAIWNGTITSRAPSTIVGNRYVFAEQQILTFSTIDFSKVYGVDLTGSAAVPFAVSGYHAGIAGAFLGDTAASAHSGNPLIQSDGLAERASVAGGPYAQTIALGSLQSDSGYTFAFAPSTGLITVTPKAVTGIISANSKVYDGNVAGSGAVTLNGVLAGDSVGTTGSVFTFADKNAGTGKAVNVTGTTLNGTDSGNYTLTIPASVLADIFKKSITGTITADSKTYDGNMAGTGTVSLTGVVAGDVVGTTGSVFTFAGKNAGANKTVTVTGTTLNGTDSGNYTLTLPASALADILQKALTATVTVNGKTYDGTIAATGSVALNGVVAGDSVGTTGSVFTFADKNAGTGKAVNVTGTTLNGADSGNYTLTIPASALADILKKSINGSLAVDNKTYNGTTTATGTVTLSGVVAGDSVGTTGSVFTFADKNAGTGKTVTVTGTTLSGADSGNYTLTIPASALADILKKSINGTITADNKTYDGTTVGSGSIALNGVVAGDAVSTTGSVFTFADKNAGTSKTVNLTGTTLNGADSGNYTLTVPASTLADILQKALTATVTANGKTYDGTTSASGSVALNGVVSGDAVGTTGSVFTFTDKNAGTGKTVNVTGTTLNGADSGNYTLTVPASALADILQKALTATVSANGKTYDGTTVGSGTVALNGVVGGDVVSTGGITFTFTDKNAGTGKAVAVGGTLSGADAGNYTVSLPTTVLADILKKSLTATVTANGKTYDGTTAGTGSVALNGVVGGDLVSTGGITFTFADKNAGTGKAVAVGGSVSGADAGNYTVNLPAIVLADILQKALTATVTINGKTYDGTTAATGSVALNGVVAGDTVGTSGTAFAFTDKNAGTGKTVSVSGATLTGTDSGNYTLTIPASVLADIAKRGLSLSADDKEKYSRDPDPALTYTITLGSLVAGDQLTGALTRAEGETPGDYAIGQGSLTAGDNYTLTFTPGTLTISIDPATNQPQTLRTLPLPSGIQAPPPAGSTVNIDAEALCSDDSSCVAN